MSKPTKTTLNQLAQTHYGPQSTCEYIRTGGKQGWYLHNGEQQTLIGKNVAKAFEYLQSLEVVPEKIIDSEETSTKPEEIAKPEVTTTKSEIPKELKTKPQDGPLTSEQLLATLFEKFPKVFFHESEQIKPLQLRIHKHIHRALDKKYDKKEIRKALILYTQTKEYCEAIVREQFRIDIEGNPEKEIIKSQKDDAQARLTGEFPMRTVIKSRKKPPREQRPPPPVLDELVTGKIDVTLKINELPANSKTLKNDWEGFTIKAENASVKMAVRPKAWKKLQKASRDYPSWIANIRGKMGEKKKDGFELEMPGIQIFDTSKKPET